MKKLLRKYLISGDGAISPVIGVMLMLLLIVLLAGITVSAIYGDDIFGSLSKAPMAVIEVESVEGGVPNGYGYAENYIVLVHKGGESLQTGCTKIIISGEGSAYTGVFGPGGSIRHGDLFVSYDDITFAEKASPYASRNPDIQDSFWSAGEKLILNGKDGDVGSAPCSVHATINGMTNTSDNYGLKENSIITIKVFDSESDKIIAKLEHEVTPAH